MNEPNSLYKNVELRKLPIGRLCGIINILEDNKTWEYIIPFIPQNPNSDIFVQKYNTDDVRLIENHAKETGRKCAEILFEEWGTSGRIRPTLYTVKEVLIKAELLRAADIVAEMLREEPVPRPDKGPAAIVPIDVPENDDSTNITNGNGTTAPVVTIYDEIEYQPVDLPEGILQYGATTAKLAPDNVNDERDTDSSGSKLSTLDDEKLDSLSNGISYLPNLEIFNQSPTVQASNENSEDEKQDDLKRQNKRHNFQRMKSDIENLTNLKHFEYKLLTLITNNFSEPVGSGGFGEVFIGRHPVHGLLAVKRTHSHHIVNRQDVTMKLFNTEVKLLSQFRHINIVPILGYSKDGPARCIVCKYVDGGSLKENLMRKFLSEKQRIDIMLGTAEGLAYLHRGGDAINDRHSQSLTNDRFLHGDVKSDNILLTKDCVPKLCDFGLAKSLCGSYLQVTSLIGTTAYMAPEWLSGTITQKIDIYSFGIVLLEVLTGLPPIVNKNGEEFNIQHYLKEKSAKNDIAHINECLDSVVPKWTKAKELAVLAKRCLHEQRNKRYNIGQVCHDLHKIKGLSD